MATYEQDDDGIAAGAVELIDDKQKSQIVDYIDDMKADLSKFLAYMKLEKLEDMKKSDFPKAINALEAKRKKVQK